MSLISFWESVNSYMKARTFSLLFICAALALRARAACRVGKGEASALRERLLVPLPKHQAAGQVWGTGEMQITNLLGKEGNLEKQTGH